METQEVTILRVNCDGCSKPHYVNRGENPPGFIGTVIDPDDSASSFNWFACRDRCIRNAVVNVLG